MSDDAFAPIEPINSGENKPKPISTKVIIPVPLEAFPFEGYRHYKYGQPSAFWPYHNADGQIIAYAARFDFVNKRGKPDKDVIPVCWCHVEWPGRTVQEWHGIGVPEPRPLFNLPALLANPTAPVVFCEGEKTALMVSQRFPGYVGTTTMGGAKAPHLTDFSPLAERVVTGFPDNDLPGRDYIDIVAALSTKVSASVSVVTVPPGLPDKWDIADNLPANYPPQLIFEALRSAKPWQPPAGGFTPTMGTEDHLADEFSKIHADDFRYVATWGKWLRWDGTRWKSEDTLLVFDEGRKIAREFSKLLEDDKLSKAQTVAAIERLARSDRRHATMSDIWDHDLWLLNTPGGVINLRNGETIAHDPSLHITKITAVAPDGYCPRWRQFLAEVTGGNADLQSYLQRVAGYNLTGVTTEHKLFFYYGSGRNGKGVYLNTLSAILSEYAEVAPMDAFLHTINDRHPTDLAGLRGSRFVTAQEIEKGRRWADAKIKAITGGDPISARFMRQDFFKYIPTFKLNIAGNNKPGLNGVDEAIKARFDLIPFTVYFPEDKRDKDLSEKLREEWPGILQWTITGCLDWQRQGLNPPPIVREATEAYLYEQDTHSRWFDDCCISGNDLFCSNEFLWLSFKSWCDRNGERSGSQKIFGEWLDNRGFAHGKEKGERGHHGIYLKPQPLNMNYWPEYRTNPSD